MPNSRKLTPAILLVVITLSTLAPRGRSQFSTVPLPTPNSYTDYYSQHVYNYRLPPVNIRNYTLDRYYLRNPSISPYVHLARPAGQDTLNNYYRYVRPELERRNLMGTSTTINVLPPGGVVAPRPSPHFDFNPYFNQIYNPR